MKKVTIKKGGAGSAIKKVLESKAIKPIVKEIKKLIWKDGEDCGCDDRKKVLNDLFPKRFIARCFTEDEHKDWGSFKEVRTLNLSAEQVSLVCQMYSDVFHRLYWRPCIHCSQKPLIEMIDKLDLVYKTYDA